MVKHIVSPAKGGRKGRDKVGRYPPIRWGGMPHKVGRYAPIRWGGIPDKAGGLLE